MWNMYNIVILRLGSDVVTPKNETPNSALKGVGSGSNHFPTREPEARCWDGGEVLEMSYMNSSSNDK